MLLIWRSQMSVEMVEIIVENTDKYHVSSVWNTLLWDLYFAFYSVIIDNFIVYLCRLSGKVDGEGGPRKV